MIETATKNRIDLWAKKLIVTALKGSFMIWTKAKAEPLARNKKRKEEKDSDSDEEETNEDAMKIAEKLIEEIDEELMKN
jgi:hypothetical protein